MGAGQAADGRRPWAAGRGRVAARPDRTGAGGTGNSGLQSGAKRPIIRIMATPSSPPANPRPQAASVRLPTRPATVARVSGSAPLPVLRRAHEPRQLELDLRRSV
jgi:hypothetical protein